MPEFRSFVAISLPAEARNAVYQTARHLKPFYKQVKWVPPYQYHFTLAFLGDVDQELLPQIAEATAALVADLSPFVIKVGSFGAFPSLDRARILWLGVDDGAEPLHQVYRRVWSALLPFGFVDDGSFHPHLTLGRVKSAVGHLSLTNPPHQFETIQAGFEVKEIELVKSELSTNGPKYTEIAVMPLLAQKP